MAGKLSGTQVIGYAEFLYRTALTAVLYGLRAYPINRVTGNLPDYISLAILAGLINRRMTRGL
jgi:hypothetical protein